MACCSLRRQVSAINRLAKEKFFFWDYGNAFLLEAQRAGRREEEGGATTLGPASWASASGSHLTRRLSHGWPS